MGMIVVIKMTGNGEEIVVIEINCHGGEDTSDYGDDGVWLALAKINHIDWGINLAVIYRSGGEGSGSLNKL